MSRPAELTPAAAAVIQCGLDDWVSLGEVHAIVTFHGAPVPAEAVGAVTGELVEGGLVRIGTLTAAGFVPFDEDPAAARAVLLAEYQTAAPAWPFRAWLDNTADGDALARALPQDAYLTRPE